MTYPQTRTGRGERPMMACSNGPADAEPPASEDEWAARPQTLLGLGVPECAACNCPAGQHEINVEDLLLQRAYVHCHNCGRCRGYIPRLQAEWFAQIAADTLAAVEAGMVEGVALAPDPDEAAS